MSLVIRPILAEDVPEVSDFLHRNYVSSISPDKWQQVLSPGWSLARSHCGQMLVADGKVAGVICLLYGSRQFGEEMRTTCSITTWFILPEFRKDGMGKKLLSVALADESVVYTNHTPVDYTINIFKRLDFQVIDTTEWIVANLPSRAHRISHDIDFIGERLDGIAKKNFDSHSQIPTLGHMGIEGPDGGFCHITFVRGRWHRIPLARIIYASDYGFLEQEFAAFSHAALMRFGYPLTAIEKRRCSARPALAIAKAWKQPVLFRDDNIQPEKIDGLFSEIVSFAVKV